MSQTTLFLAKLLGLFLLILGVSVLVQQQNTLDIWAALIHAVALVYVVGVITVAAGLAMVLKHNLWRGGLLPIVVTLTGWLTLLKGAAALVLPADVAMQTFAGLQYDRFLYLYAAFWLIVGAYLTIEGFRTRERSVQR